MDAGRIFAILWLLALSGLLWYAALNKSARKRAVRFIFLKGLRGPFSKQTEEDMPTFDGLVMGLGVVFAMFLDILVVFSVAEMFKH